VCDYCNHFFAAEFSTFACKIRSFAGSIGVCLQNNVKFTAISKLSFWQKRLKSPILLNRVSLLNQIQNDQSIDPKDPNLEIICSLTLRFLEEMKPPLLTAPVAPPPVIPPVVSKGRCCGWKGWTKSQVKPQNLELKFYFVSPEPLDHWDWFVTFRRRTWTFIHQTWDWMLALGWLRRCFMVGAWTARDHLGFQFGWTKLVYIIILYDIYI